MSQGKLRAYCGLCPFRATGQQKTAGAYKCLKDRKPYTSITIMMFNALNGSFSKHLIVVLLIKIYCSGRPVYVIGFVVGAFNYVFYL